MKLLFNLLLVFLFLSACCSEKKSGITGADIETVNNIGETLGKVSHKYRSTGCATVVIVNGQNSNDEIILIPLDTLASDINVEGIEIYFNYQPLKRMNPPGCNAGFPAKLYDISKK